MSTHVSITLRSCPDERRTWVGGVSPKIIVRRSRIAIAVQERSHGHNSLNAAWITSQMGGQGTLLEAQTTSSDHIWKLHPWRGPQVRSEPFSLGAVLLSGRPIFIQCQYWEELHSLYEVAKPQPSTG